VEVVLARIGRPHGIRGEVSVEVRTDDPDRRLAPGTTLRTQPASVGPLTIADGWVHSGRLILRFEGYDGRGAAEGLLNVLLVADVDPAVRPEDPDEYYDHQLVGLAAYDLDGTLLGELTAVQHGSAQDLLTIRTPDGRSTLVPFVTALVPEVDVPGGRVVIADRPGLVSPFPDEAEGAS
jgi:16S rRNA processing protein RimM